MRPENHSRDYQAWREYFLSQDEMWIFGYGSLMWRPDFAYSGCFSGCAEGVSRRYCIISVAYRGTPEKPGRVLGLVKGGECQGIAFHLQGADVATGFDVLWQREMVTNAYLPALLDVTLAEGRRIKAFVFLADPDHVQYDDCRCDATLAGIIKEAVGPCGSNLDYFNDTYSHLQQCGIYDERLSRLHVMLNTEQ